MNRQLAAFACIGLLAASLPAAGGQVAGPGAADLGQRHREWLDLVSYIVTPSEKEVFLTLRTERDRDLFIEAFWKQRDPTPGTPENEYRDEHLRRFAYADKFFRRGATREGWRTDRGRFYIILGPPLNIERFEVSAHIVPCEGWSYYGDARKGLPAHFVLLFFQRGGVGEYRLYDPVVDGPASLLVNKRDIDPTDYLELYEKIKELEPTLADLSVSFIPGEYNMDYSPSPRNAVILADILESPRKDVNTAYATHFLNFKGVVSTEYLTNYTDSEAAVDVIPDPLLGLTFIHFSVAPKTISIDYYEPTARYYCSFRLDVSLRRGKAILFQYNRDYTPYFTEEELPRIRANGIAIEDCFPAAEGAYEMTILLQNLVGKEFTVVERKIAVPGEPAGARLCGPYLGYRTDAYPRDIHLPYKMLERKVAVDPRMTFGAIDPVAFLFGVARFDERLQAGEVRILAQGLRETNPLRKSYVVRLRDQPPGRLLALGQVIPAGELEPDYYRLTLSLVDGEGKVLDESSANFIVTPERAVPHPVANSRAVSAANQFLYDFMLARQHEQAGANELAEAFFERGLAAKPDHGNGLVWYAQFLLRTGKFDRALEIAERLKNDRPKAFEYCLLRGSALLGQGRYPEAIESLLAGNRIYDSDTRLLNALGDGYRHAGRTAQALEAFRASLRLNPDQPEIRRRVAELEKRP